METILQFLKNVTPKQWGVTLLWLLAAIGLIALATSFRGCPGKARAIVNTLVESQVAGDKLLADSVTKMTETYDEVLKAQSELTSKLRELELGYQRDILKLEQSIAAKDQEIRRDISTRLAARSQQLREEYEKALADPALARDGFLDSLHLWDDLWGSQPGSTP